MRRSDAWQPRASGDEVRSLGSFLRLLEIDAAGAETHPDAFDRIRSGDLHGVIVHDVYSGDVLAPVVERLERHEPAFLQTRFPPAFRSWFYGRNLNLSHPDLPGYFGEADVFREQLASLLPPPLGIEEHVARVLAALDRGRPFLAAPGPLPDQRYMFTTLRAHLEGGFIPPHFDNEQALRPTYRHLSGVVELHMLSFVLALTQPEGGGALEVFDLCCEPEDAAILSDDRVLAKPDVSTLDSVSFRLPAGTMIVLDSGRYLHQLTPVQGARKRWTACSFMALSRTRDAMYCWG